MGATTRAVGGAALLALVAGGLFLQGLGRYPLLDPDEARHAEVAREMAAGHGLRRLFLTTLDLEPYPEKPAGYYWLVALAYAALGVNEAAARAVSALAALVAVLALYAYALPRWGLPAALGAGAVAAASAGWFGPARYGNLDMTLTACVTVGVLGGLAWLERPAPRRAPLVSYVVAGLGLLVKGPLALVLVAGPLALAALVERPRPRLGELGLERGMLTVVALGALLWVPVGLLDPSYLSAFAVTNVRRLGSASPHAGPIYYYLLWVPALLFPWTLFAVGPLRRAARDPRRRTLVLWAVFVPTVLTLARGKLATYALSALAPLALVVGTELASGSPAEDRTRLRAGGALAALALLVGAGAALFAARGYLALSARVLLAAAALGWAVGLLLVLRRARLHLVPAAVLGAALTLYPLAVREVAPAVAALHSDREAPVVLRRPLRAARGAGLDLSRPGGDREVGDERVLGLARAMRHDRAVARPRRAPHRGARLAHRPDLVQLDEDRVRDLPLDAARQELLVGDEDVVADQLHAGAERCRQPAPPGPVVLAEAVLDRDDGVGLAPALVERDQVVGRAALAA